MFNAPAKGYIFTSPGRGTGFASPQGVVAPSRKGGQRLHEVKKRGGHSISLFAQEGGDLEVIHPT